MWYCALCWQESTLFSGTVRSNLDPLGHATGDAALWEALAAVQLTEAIQAKVGGLDAIVQVMRRAMLQ